MKLGYRHTAYAAYGGFISQAITNNLAPLLFILFKTRFGVNDEQLGRLIVFNFGTQIVADVVATKWGDRWGYRKSAVIAHILCAAGLVLMGILPMVTKDAYAGLCIAAVLYAFGGGFIEVVISPIIDSLPGEEKDKAMSLAHSFYCWGQMAVVLLTTAAIKLFGFGRWYLLPILWALIPAANAVLFTRVPVAATVSEKDRTPMKALLSNKLFFLAMIMMVASGASELAMSQWSSLFAEQGLKVNKLAGDLLGPCLFAFCQACGRTLYGMFGEKIDLNRALAASGALCVACYLTAVLSGNPVLALAGCALCGLSVALMWPGTLSVTAARFPMGGTAMFGILAVCGDIGGSLGPWVTGIVSDALQKTDLAVRFSLTNEQLGLRGGLLIAAVFPLMLFVSTLITAHRREK